MGSVTRVFRWALVAARRLAPYVLPFLLLICWADWASAKWVPNTSAEAFPVGGKLRSVAKTEFEANFPLTNANWIHPDWKLIRAVDYECINIDTPTRKQGSYRFYYRSHWYGNSGDDGIPFMGDECYSVGLDEVGRFDHVDLGQVTQCGTSAIQDASGLFRWNCLSRVPRARPGRRLAALYLSIIGNTAL